MRRRDFITFLAGAVAWPFQAGAQQSSMRRVGILVLGNPDPAPFIAALRDELHMRGYSEGQRAAHARLQ
jgi:putative tryptophan/tyrosine transport system substrate-binding protein